MKWPHFMRLLPVVAILFLMQCKSQEQAAKQEEPPIANTPCVELSKNITDDDLTFFAEAEADSGDLAARKAKKETVIKLVQFFQSEFIDGSQAKFLDEARQMGGWEKFRKQWAETSFEAIGELHNRNAFNHHQNITQDSTGTFRAVNMLAISKDWIRNHWEETLKATDPAVYTTAIQEEGNPVRKLEVQKEQPCE